jgi:acyl-CoA synthetase (NDP forming)
MTLSQDQDHKPERGTPAGVAPPPTRPELAAMLEARSVAVVGASRRPGSFGQRMVEEVAKSPSRPETFLVNPGYDEIAGQRCVPSLADLPDPVDLVMLGVPDAALEQQLTLAAARGDRSAVIFGNAVGSPPDRADRPPVGTAADGPPTGTAAAGTLRERLAAIAGPAGMALCGAGCMGFVNVARGLRAVGYTEPDPLPSGPVALVTHSGSVFSAMLRTRRGIGYTLAVSSGQELVTAAPAYLDYALGLPETKVLALVLEAIREPARLRQVLARAAERDLPVVLLTVGRSQRGRTMVAAHSGALAAAGGGWEALARAHGVHRVNDLAELADTLELFAIGRRAPGGAGRGRGGAGRGRGGGGGRGIATVHDSGLERAHAADLADDVGVPFAAIREQTKARLAGILDPGLTPANPLDVWGTGADTRGLFTGALVTLARDPAVAAVALAVDLVTELDGDDSYRLSVLDAAAQTTKPVVVLGNVPSAVDPGVAAQLRQHGIPVLESLRSGLVALRALLAHATHPPSTAGLDGAAGPAPAGLAPAGRGNGGGRKDRAGRRAALLAAGVTSGPALLALLREYGIAAAAAHDAHDEPGALAAAQAVGYPVVLKTADPAISHKSDVGGVALGLSDPAALAAAYRDLAARLGPRVLVCQSVPPGTELALGITRDPDLGPLIVVGAGGVLAELLADRAVALPPVDEATARELLAGLRVGRLLAGVRGAPPADLGAVVRAITGLSDLACELGDGLAALDVNPLICGPHGATAVDVLALPR